MGRGRWASFGSPPTLVLGLWLAVIATGGCARQSDPAEPPRAPDSGEAEQRDDSPNSDKAANDDDARNVTVPPWPSEARGRPVFQPPRPAAPPEAPPDTEQALAGQPPDPQPNQPPARVAEPAAELPPLAEVPDARLVALGLRRTTGRHLTLTTDVAAEVLDDAGLADLVAAFDAAYPAWCRYLGWPVDPDWHVSGHLMADRAVFQALGLWRESLPDFRFGYAHTDAIWMTEVGAGDYYRRHLMLHEGVHAAMFGRFGTGGPPWYAEGMAELLATHRWQDGEIELPIFPASPAETPHLGRIQLVREAVAAGRGLTLGDVLALGPRAHQALDAYGWCWALASFFEHHPRYRRVFRSLAEGLADPEGDVSRRLLAGLGPERRLAELEWLDFIHRLDHGWDFERNQLLLAPDQRPSSDVQTIEIQADRAWQSTGLRVEAGQPYHIEARGRFTIARDPDTGAAWPCEPQGVTIRYHQGRPLGQLLGMVLPARLDETSLAALANPIGLGGHWAGEFPHGGTLYLRLNDSPAGYAENAGTVTVFLQERLLE